MPSLDDLKKRIKSVKSTQKITKAMKMVAAAKLRKAQENAEKGRPYSQKMQNIILNLTKSINDPENVHYKIMEFFIKKKCPSRKNCKARNSKSCILKPMYSIAVYSIFIKIRITQKFFFL